MDAPNRRRKSKKPHGAPAITVEGRENQLISLAVDLAQEQLSNGTASAQVITHFLRLGTMRAKLEMEKLKQEALLIEAKTKSLEGAQRIEQLYAEALSAMRTYQGNTDDLDDEEL